MGSWSTTGTAAILSIPTVSMLNAMPILLGPLITLCGSQRVTCEHAQCNAHPLGELCFLEEHEKQAWAGQLKEHLLACHLTVEEARASGETSLPTWVIEQLTTTYHQLIEAGLAAQ